MAKRPYETIFQQFQDFDAANPQVYTSLVAKTRWFVAQGYNYITIALVFELFRCDPTFRTTTSKKKSGYKLCNDYRAHYARKIMNENADLQGIFQVRGLRAA